MSRGVREAIESVLLAGMKSGAPVAQSQPAWWLGPLRAPFERFLAGSAPADPLYLSHRTIWQRVKLPLLFALPCVFVGSLMALALNDYFVRQTPIPRMDPSPAELAAKTLPNLTHAKVEANRDVDVIEVRIDRGSAAALVGTVINTTTRQIDTAEIVFDLSDATGSHLGGVTQKLQDLEPRKPHPFRLAIDQKDARFAIVSEVRLPTH